MEHYTAPALVESKNRDVARGALGLHLEVGGAGGGRRLECAITGNY